MNQIVHITFEKLTGLKGTIEGDFICVPESIDAKLPLVFEADLIHLGYFVFRQGEKDIPISPVSFEQYSNYAGHFIYGTNFLIKEWSYGGGVRINSQNPN